MQTQVREVQPIEILLVEDHPGDARLTIEAFHHCDAALRLHHAWNGLEAMAFLRRLGAPRPALVLLDLKMPEMGGRETLAQIKSDANLRDIPTIVLTNSDDEADVLACYKLGANCYLRKPPQWDAFDALMRSIDAFWLTRAKLPH
jgi:two-component system, chemotaxis family, response regulator Rcp1